MKFGFAHLEHLAHDQAQIPRRDLQQVTLGHLGDPLQPTSPRDAVPASDSASREVEDCDVPNPLQRAIWRESDIEVPIIEFRGSRYVRVSCHL